MGEQKLAALNQSGDFLGASSIQKFHRKSWTGTQLLN